MPPRREVTLRSATSSDYRALVHLLEAAHLPTAGLPPTLGGFCIAEDRDRVVGGVGVELYGSRALLRSAVVAPDLRGEGIGPALVGFILDYARARGVLEVFLLTTTAEGFFRHQGFAVIGRAEVPDAVTKAVEFRGACPASAVVMRMRLPGEAGRRGDAAEDRP